MLSTTLNLNWISLLPLTGRGKARPTLGEVGRALVLEFGGEIIDESIATYLPKPAYEATFLSTLASVYGRVWVFQRDKDLVVCLLFSEDPRQVGKHSEGAKLVNQMEF